MARPQGEISQRVLEVVSRVISDAKGDAAIVLGTWRDVYRKLLEQGVQATEKVVRWAVQRLVQRKQLVELGDAPVPGSRRPMKVYGVPRPGVETAVTLASAMSLWGAPTGNA